MKRGGVSVKQQEKRVLGSQRAKTVTTPASFSLSGKPLLVESPRDTTSED